MPSQTKESRLREILSLSGYLENITKYSSRVTNEITEIMFTESEDFGAAVIHHVRSSTRSAEEECSNYRLTVADLTPGLKIVEYSSVGLIESHCRSLEILMLKREGDTVVIKYNNGEEEKIRRVKITVETVHTVQLV